MVAQPDRLVTVADDLLEAARAALDDNGRDVPDRRYVTVGEIAADCDLLVVSAIRVYPDRPNLERPTEQQVAVPLRAATFHVERWRCVTSGSEATIGSLDADGRTLQTDGWTLTRGLIEAVRAGDVGSCRHAEVTEGSALGPEGGMAGWRVVVDVLLI